jgi:hypothetical protein
MAVDQEPQALAVKAVSSFFNNKKYQFYLQFSSLPSIALFHHQIILTSLLSKLFQVNETC